MVFEHASTSNARRRKREASPKFKSRFKSRFKKSRMLPTPGLHIEDVGTPDEEASPLDASNAENVAFALETLTPFTPNTMASPRPVYPSNEKIYECTYEGCTKSFNRPIRLTEHLNSHLGIRPYNCGWPGCAKTYMKQPHLSEHVKTHTGSKDYECTYDDCDKRFRTQQKLRHHFKTHENAERFQCTGYPPCDEYFRKEQTLQRHITSVHLGKRPFPCVLIDTRTNKECSQSFKQSSHLYRHIERCHRGPSFFCRICPATGASVDTPAMGEVDSFAGDGIPTSMSSGLGFATYQQLLDHEHEVHPPICPFCHKECPHQKELRRHVEVYHKETCPQKEKIFKCNIDGCEKTFQLKSNMMTHVRATHLKLKPYICGTTDLVDCKDADVEKWDGQSACGDGFKAKASLIDHVRTAHMGLLRRRRWVKLTAEAAASPKIKISKKSQPGLRTIAELTGVVKENHIPCLALGCPNLFKRSFNLLEHMQKIHGIEESDIPEIMFERQAVSGGHFWMGGDQDEDDVEDDEEEEHAWNNSDNDTNADDEMEDWVEGDMVMEDLTPEEQHKRRAARYVARNQSRTDARLIGNQVGDYDRYESSIPAGLTASDSAEDAPEEWQTCIDPALRSL